MVLHILSADGAAISRPAQAGQTILEALSHEAGLAPHAPCGGQGRCEKCTVYLLENGAERPVLACQTPVSDGMTVRLSENRALQVELGISGVTVPDGGMEGYGVACDLGTTTIACRLVDLRSGEVLAALGAANEQRRYGADVITRIQASIDGKRRALTDCVVTQLSELLGELCEAAGVPVDAVRAMSLAGNTTMCHLLAGLPPDSMGYAPFTPLSLFGEALNAEALGFPFHGSVYISPAVSAYVGGDISADLLAAGIDRQSEPVLLIDVGTNGEMALGCGDKLLCCATAAGPAFEGAHIRFGMTAAEGAVSELLWDGSALTIKTIGGGQPIGICGSGLIDAVAAFLDMGLLDETGRLADPDEDDISAEALPYLGEFEGEAAVLLAEGLWVTQSDIRKLQLGKGAIAAGVEVLLRHADIAPESIDALLLAGGFGSYIRPRSAARIGLIPQKLLSVTRAAGNLAAQGAYMALLSAENRRRLSAIQNSMDYLELSGLAAFNEAYMEAMLFPETE